jgi:predicted nucleic acid-binding protein
MNSNKIFIDTSYIVGLLVEEDKWNKRAKELISLIDKKEKIISLSIVNESITLINKKRGVEDSKQAYRIILNNFTIIDENMGLYTESMNILIKYHSLSLTDSVIVELMKKHNIFEIVSFDEDFDKIDGIVRIH